MNQVLPTWRHYWTAVANEATAFLREFAVPIEDQATQDTEVPTLAEVAGAGWRVVCFLTTAFLCPSRRSAATLRSAFSIQRLREATDLLFDGTWVSRYLIGPLVLLGLAAVIVLVGELMCWAVFDTDVEPVSCLLQWGVLSCFELFLYRGQYNRVTRFLRAIGLRMVCFLERFLPHLVVELITPRTGRSSLWQVISLVVLNFIRTFRSVVAKSCLSCSLAIGILLDSLSRWLSRLGKWKLLAETVAARRGGRSLSNQIALAMSFASGDRGCLVSLAPACLVRVPLAA